MAKSPLVYLIDPQDDDRECVSRQIEVVKLECRAFGDADEFLAVYEPGRVACELTELQLGNATVFQLVKLLRHRLSSVPVILLTAHATVRLAVQACKSDVFEVLEKPVDAEDAVRMLQRLSGRWHDVITSVCLLADGVVHEAQDVTTVKFRSLDEAALRAYVATGEPRDKAGAYGIQGYGAALVERIEGDFFSVMGLPLRLVLELLERAGRPYRFPAVEDGRG